MSRPVATPRNPHWAQIDEFSFVAGMRLLFWLCRVAGRWRPRHVELDLAGLGPEVLQQ